MKDDNEETKNPRPNKKGRDTQDSDDEDEDPEDKLDELVTFLGINLMCYSLT